MHSSYLTFNRGHVGNLGFAQKYLDNYNGLEQAGLAMHYTATIRSICQMLSQPLGQREERNYFLTKSTVLQIIRSCTNSEDAAYHQRVFTSSIDTISSDPTLSNLLRVTTFSEPHPIKPNVTCVKDTCISAFHQDTRVLFSSLLAQFNEKSTECSQLLQQVCFNIITFFFPLSDTPLAHCTAGNSCTAPTK